MTAPRSLASLLNPGVFVALIASTLLVLLAYQVRPSYNIVFGTPTDVPLLDGFHTGEFVPQNTNLGYRTFRWMEGYGRVTFADVGTQPFTAILTVNGARPAGQVPPMLRVQVAGSALLDVQPPPALSTYTFTVPANLVAAGNGSFTLELSANAFHVKGDARELGIITTRLALQPAPDAPLVVKPQTSVVLLVIATSTMLALLLALLGWGWLGVGVGGSVPGLLAAGLLIFDRLWLTAQHWYDRWPAIVLFGGTNSPV